MKPQGFSSSRPSKQTTQHSSNHNYRQSSVNSTEHQGLLSNTKQGSHQSAMTPVQQKFSSNLLNSSGGAAINNYLSSGTRAVAAGEASATVVMMNQSHPSADLFLNQFNRSNLKKSEVKQLQKYCEQNGLDFNSIYNQPAIHSQQQSKSLSKERKVSVPQPGAQQQQFFMHQHSNSGVKQSQNSKSQSHRPNQKSYQTPQSSLVQPHQQPFHQYTNHSATNNQSMLHNSSSLTAMMLERSPLSSNPKISNKSGAMALVNFQVMPTAGGVAVPQTSTSQPNAVSGPQQHRKSQVVASMHHPMMPSQMSYQNSNEALLHQQSQYREGDNHQAHGHQMQAAVSSSQQNFSASNGYFSQKASPMGRLSVGTGGAITSPDNHVKQNATGLKSNKVIRQPHVTGPGTSKAKGTNLHTNLSQKDLSAAYQAVATKRSGIMPSSSSSQGVNAGHGHHTNSATQLDKSTTKYQIDSGVGVITGGQGGSSLNHPNRKDAYQRGIQVEMKTALHSRRKHGSIETYKQSSNHHNSGHQIRQGQGEIAQQRVAVAKNNNIIFKGGQGNQLPKVIRNQNSKTGVVTGGASSRLSAERVMHQSNPQQQVMMSSTPSINQASPQKVARHSAGSPSDEMRYQNNNQSSSNYTNAVRQSALSRGSIKQSTQHALSGSNQMNLSLSQNSSRGLHQKTQKDVSVEQFQERRIAYEASQGKMSNGNVGLRQNTTNSSSEMLLAYQQHKQAGHQPGVFMAPQQEEIHIQQQKASIVLNHQKQTGNSQRHSRIRTKSNHSSLDRITNQEMASKSKRGAITAAQNSPRQALTQLKSKQPRIPEANSEIDKYYNSRVAQQQPVSNNSGSTLNTVADKRKLSTGKDQPTTSYHLAKAMKAQSSSLISKTPSQDFHTVTNGGASSSQQRQPSIGQSQIDHQAHMNHQHSISTASQPRFTEEPQTNTIEQYSRKLQTPSPILDGGTGSGGAQVSNLQHQTRQLLKEQQVLLEKLGYVPTQPLQQQPSAELLQSQTSKVQVYQPTSHHPQNSQHLMDQQKVLAYHNAKQASQHSTNAQHQKKTTLLQMQQQANSNKQLNLSHSLVGSQQNLKSAAQTKTSAQTASTIKGVGHPKFLQYVNSKQSTANSGTQAVNLNASSLKLKKNSMAHQQNVNPSQQTNLIMHQNASKRSSSQEIVIQNKAGQQQQQSVKMQQMGQVTDIGIQGIGSVEQPQSHFRAGAAAHKNAEASKRLKNNSSSVAAKGGEKRSSSQPTVMATVTNSDMVSGQHQVKYLPKHYNDEKKQRMYYQNRRLSDDPVVMSRQSAAARPSQKSQQQSRTSVSVNNNEIIYKGGKAYQVAAGAKGSQEYQQNRSNSNQNIDFQSVRVSIAASNDSKLKPAGAKKLPSAVSGQQATQSDEQSHAVAKRLRKQTSVPQLHPQIQGSAHHQHNRSELSKSSKQSSGHMRKSQSNGPGRPQYSVNQPNAVARPETTVSDLDARRLITEEDEQEIRQVASDINEQAFYGKIIRTKKALKTEAEFAKLSPRSQEIGYVMQKVERAFALTQQPPITDITFYRIGKMLGRGAFGKVNLAMHKLVRKLVALKSLNKQALTDEVQKAKLMKEVNLLLKLRHNHVVKIYETIETQKHIIIVMELCAGGDLLNYVRKRRRLKEPFAQKIFRQIIDGLSYIHSKHIAHRDIKLDNILLDGKGNVKIADFGVSRQIQPDQIMREQCGTPAYIAPEILRNRGYGLNVDLWSAGVVLFAMLYGTVPFKAQTMDELHQLILKGKYLLKEDISVEARDLLRGLLEINPKKRISIRKIYKHPWLRSMDPSVQLFNDEERKMIKKEYTYNDGSRYNRNENEEPVDCFTQHNLESQYSTLKNQESKSIILAPFNSTMSEQTPRRQSETRSKVMELMEVKQQVLRFSKKCREIDRQYEFNNNGQLDNGVYHKVVANNSFEQQDKFEETQGIEIEQSLHDSVRQQRKGKSASNARNNNEISASEQSSFLSIAEDYNIQNNQPKPLDPAKVQKLVSFGYPEEYVIGEMREMHPNYCTAGYYLLEMDQNYC